MIKIVNKEIKIVVKQYFEQIFNKLHNVSTHSSLSVKLLQQRKLRSARNRGILHHTNWDINAVEKNVFFNNKQRPTIEGVICFHSTAKLSILLVEIHFSNFEHFVSADSCVVLIFTRDPNNKSCIPLVFATEFAFCMRCNAFTRFLLECGWFLFRRSFMFKIKPV